MKKDNRLLVCCIVLVFVLTLVGARMSVVSSLIPYVSADEDTSWQDAYEYIGSDTVWHKTDALVFTKEVYIDNNATLTIEAGAKIRLNGGGLTVSHGNILAQGTESDPITITSDNDVLFTVSFASYDDVVGVDEKTSSLQYVHIVKGGTYNDPNDCAILGHKKSFFIETAFASNCPLGASALQYNSGRVNIEHTNFIGSHYTDIFVNATVYEYTRNDFLHITSSNFGDNTQATAVISHTHCQYDFSAEECGHKIVMKDNWWGNASGPTVASSRTETTNPEGLGNRIDDSGDSSVVFRPFAQTAFSNGAQTTACVENCFSNVLFLPGIKASRLYRDGNLGKDKLWLPNYFGNDLEELALDENGKSIENVYTEDVLSEALFPWAAGINIYKTFLAKLDGMKANHTINDYQSFAYDWRKNVEDIIQEGALYPQGVMRSLTTDADMLAKSSKSGKITIVAHSNGGLLAKALMLALEQSGQADKVDKIVFVGTPQMGTPIAALSLLYGYDESLLAGTLVSRKDARTLAENMPGVYGLLPSETYFERTDEPFMTFSSEQTRYKQFKNIYGDGIGSFDEMKSFLSGEGDSRAKPSASDVEFENVLGKNFINQAKETHRRLDAWTPPAGVEAIQIAGWGLDTVSGVEYTQKEKTQCHPTGTPVPSCTGMGEYDPVYEPKFTVDGDEVVVAPSALMLSDAPNIKKYWVDLYRSNKFFTQGREHKDLLEFSSLQDFLSTVIMNTYSSTQLPNYMYDSRPSDYANTKPRLRMSLYSPLDIHLYDSVGHHTGPKKVTVDGQEQTIFETDIPNSYYYQFGERKYVGFGGGEPVRIEMDGYDTGSYTLKLEEVKQTQSGEETTAHTTFENLPVTNETTVTLAIPETGLTDLAPLEADVNGDGSNDYTVKPVPNGTATLDMIAPETSINFSGTSGTNGWYVSDVSATLSAMDNEGGSGVDIISYSLDKGATWQTYVDAIVFSQEEIKTLQYFATDKQGNKEAVKTADIKIDKTAPEAKMTFNPSTQKMDIIGTDNLSNVAFNTTTQESVPSKYDHWWDYFQRKKQDTKTRSITTLTDEAGHALVLTFSSDKNRNKDRRVEQSLESVVYDGAVTNLSEISLQYKWQMQKRNTVYTMLASRLNSGLDSIESHYRFRKNVTVIMQRPQDLDDNEEENENDRRPVKETLLGMMVPYLQTNQGRVTIGYSN